MKTEINLRPHEFVTSREFYWPRLVRTIAAVLLLFSLAVGSVLGYLYMVNLRNDLVNLAGTRDELKLKAAPVIQLEQAIERVSQGVALEKSFLGTVTPWSRYLQKIKSAAGKEIRVVQMSATVEGKITVDGQAENLKDIAIYAQNLENLDFLSQVAITQISLGKENRLAFVLNAVSTTGGGLGNYD